jgi:nicotinate dehydrogenase subunit B
MRGDEHVWEHYGTPMIMEVKGGLDADGNLIAWDYESLQAARGDRPGNVGAANLPTGAALIGLTLARRRAPRPASRRSGRTPPTRSPATCRTSRGSCRKHA